MFQIRLIIASFLTLAFLPGTLLAQYSSGDSGQYVILNAQYGTPRRHVDRHQPSEGTGAPGCHLPYGQ